jgi:hypothetical protein
MKLFGAALILCAAFAYVRGQTFDFKFQVGVVDVNERGNTCLIISNGGLSNGIPVNIIVLSKRQSIVRARIKEKLSQSCSANPDVPDASFYSLEFSASDSAVTMRERQAAGIAVVSSKQIVVQHGRASVDLDNDGRREFFRDCTSNEGVHFTVWTGLPFCGKRRWHFYYYLGYDVVPSCKRKDYM